MKKERAIVLGVSSDWSFLLGTFLISLKRNSPSACDNIIVFHDGIKDSEKEIILSIFDNIIFKDFNYECVNKKIGCSIPDSAPLRRYSLLVYSIYETFDLLSKYKNVAWIDVDILIQNDISCIFDTKYVSMPGSSVSLNKSLGVKIPSKYNIDGEKSYYNSGVMSLSDKIDYKKLTSECYKFTSKFINSLYLPDQSVISLVLLINKIPVNILGESIVCSYFNAIHSSTAPMIHGWGMHGKFWINPIVAHSYPEWVSCYKEWLSMGGSEHPPKKLVNTHIVKGLGSSALIEHFNYNIFWINFYEKNKFFMPHILKPHMNINRNYSQLHIENVDTRIHYEFIYKNKTDIHVALHFEDAIIADIANSYFDKAQFPEHTYKFEKKLAKHRFSIETLAKIDEAGKAMHQLFDVTYHELMSIWNIYKNNLNLQFESIYVHNRWGQGSGAGSDKDITKEYRVFLENFLIEKKIQTVVDAGCGDWQFSKFINWSKTSYTGYDVAEYVIKNNMQYEKENIRFYHYDGDFLKMKDADLLICKDVLQYLSNELVMHFIKSLSKYKYALIANTFVEEIKENTDIKIGACRPLDLRKPPFNLKCEEVFRIVRQPSTSDIAVFLWTNENKL